MDHLCPYFDREKCFHCVEFVIFEPQAWVFQGGMVGDGTGSLGSQWCGEFWWDALSDSRASILFMAVDCSIFAWYGVALSSSGCWSSPLTHTLRVGRKMPSLVGNGCGLSCWVFVIFDRFVVSGMVSWCSQQLLGEGRLRWPLYFWVR